MVFDIMQGSQAISEEPVSAEALERWRQTLLAEGRAAKAQAASQKSLTPADVETMAREIFERVSKEALNSGVILGDEDMLWLLGYLSGLGPLLEIISRPGVEDVAVNLGHIYVYTTSLGWQHLGPSPAGIGDAVRVLIDRAGQIPPTTDHPIADAMLQVMLPTPDGITRKGIRVNYIMPPASPYGDTITLRVINYRTGKEERGGSLGRLTSGRLPPVSRPEFHPLDFPRGDGVLSPEAANYLLSIMVAGGTLILAGATGSGKTYVAGRILQEMLDFFPLGAIRLFIIEDSNEIVLNGWDGSGGADTGNVVYTVTRPEIQGGPDPITMYQLVRAALRSRPHGLIIGEARGEEAWELVRASATGHGHSCFTIHATSAEHTWYRFEQVVRAHPDVKSLSEYDIARNFAEAVTAIAYIERNPRFGQVMTEIVEVSPLVERAANRPTLTHLFKFNPEKNVLLPTGNRPMRPGFRAADLGLPESFFMGQR
jgi:Flp pilus assembly CpaF family ATPase